MRFLLYNIRYGTGTGWRFHVPFPFSGYIKRTHRKFLHLVKFIKEVNPDVIGLLEVDCGSIRTKKTSQLVTLSQALKHFYVYQSKYSAKSILQRLPLTRKQGNAFLTNKKIQNQSLHYFSTGIKRLIIELELEDCVILLVHLSIKYRHRQEQLHDIYAHVGRITKPLIVAGDFNTMWGPRELKLFLVSSGLSNANNDGLPSHPSRSPKREIDFILHSKGIRVRSFHMPDVRFSDHRPLVCDFDVVADE